MKRVVMGLALVVALLVVVLGALAVVGAMQPREHEVSRTVQLDAPPAAVFAILEDVAAYPCWRTEVDTVEVLQTQPLRFIEHSDDDSLRFRVIEREENQRLVVQIDDEDLPFGGGWTHELSPSGSGTTLTITERGFIDSTIVRGMATLLMDPIESILRFQEDLKAHHRCE